MSIFTEIRSNQFAEDFLQINQFRRVDGRGERTESQPVFLRRIRSGGETVVLCRSDGRRDKENAIQDNAERRLVEELEKLAGYTCTWRTLRRRLQTHCYTTLIDRLKTEWFIMLESRDGPMRPRS